MRRVLNEYCNHVGDYLDATPSQPCERGSEAGTFGVMVCSAGGGLKVTSVRSGSPAARAAILTGDIITSIDGKPVFSRNDIETAIAANTTGTVKVGYLIQGNFLVEYEAKVRWSQRERCRAH